MERLATKLIIKNRNDIRTANACEGFHSRLIKMFYSHHPNISVLIDALLEIQDISYLRMTSTRRGYQRPSDKEKQQYTQELVNKYVSGTLTRYEFVKYVSAKFLPTVI